MTGRACVSAALPACIGALLLVGNTGATAQEHAAGERGGPLSVPEESGQAVLETGSGLSRPAPEAGALRIPSPSTATPFEPGDSATRARPARLELALGGALAPELRSLLSTDLAYVREVRVDDGGELVVEGRGVVRGDEAVVELTLRHREAGSGVLRRSWRGPRAELTRFAHGFVDDAVEALTGRRSAFASRLVFARRVAAGRKDVLAVETDGSGVELLSSGDGIAMLPSVHEDGVWYTVLRPTGTFITRTGLSDRPVVDGPGMHMGATVCGERLYFSSSRGGNSDIWSTALDGTDQRQLTHDEAIEVSPSCTPDRRIAFVSDRTGAPQIWAVDAAGGRAQQLTDTPHAAQTPALCGHLLAFTGVGGGMPMRVAVMDLRTRRVRRVSPPGGHHKDPTFSPDCRLLAWASPEGVVIATPDGRLRRVVLPGHAETVRWMAD